MAHEHKNLSVTRCAWEQRVCRHFQTPEQPPACRERCHPCREMFPKMLCVDRRIKCHTSQKLCALTLFGSIVIDTTCHTPGVVPSNAAATSSRSKLCSSLLPFATTSLVSPVRVTKRRPSGSFGWSKAETCHNEVNCTFCVDEGRDRSLFYPKRVTGGRTH